MKAIKWICKKSSNGAKKQPLDETTGMQYVKLVHWNPYSVHYHLHLGFIILKACYKTFTSFYK